MHYRQLAAEPKTYIIIFDSGDELASGVKRVAEELRLSSASFKAIGAFSSVRLAWFNWQTKKYEPSVVLNEQVELLSLIGDIALQEGAPQVHAHVVIGKADGTAHGGHLQQAHVRPTCELIVTESPQHLQKRVDPESGLALIKL